MQKRKHGAINEISEHPIAFAGAFFAFFVLIFIFLSWVGATPNPITSDPNAVPASSGAVTTPQVQEAPVRVVAASIGLNVAVANPTTTDVDVLDQALTGGAVHYPTSSNLGINGTVLLFGHSSYLPIVYHQYYKTFDGIQNLKTGDIVSVYSGTSEYRYSVVGVKVADATSDVIPLPSDAKYLTLVTCDSFATKSNRFIVTANFVGAYALAQ